jgi:hypothetical protein
MNSVVPCHGQPCTLVTHRRCLCRPYDVVSSLPSLCVSPLFAAIVNSTHAMNGYLGDNTMLCVLCSLHFFCE